MRNHSGKILRDLFRSGNESEKIYKTTNPYLTPLISDTKTLTLTWNHTSVFSLTKNYRFNFVLNKDGKDRCESGRQELKKYAIPIVMRMICRLLFSFIIQWLFSVVIFVWILMENETQLLGDDIVISFINIPLYLYLYLCVCFLYHQFTLYIILYTRNSRTLSNHVV